ncbi:MAG: response regulator [Bacteroidales bacterium]|nr:response regulator [Bacteroidales bacterium]
MALCGKLPAQTHLLSVSSERSNPTITALVQDEDGYLWIGTRRGLNRYNGSTYKIYSMADSTGLSSDRIFSLCPDTEGRLWVGTESGLNLIHDGQVIRRPYPRFSPVTAILNFSGDRLLYAGPLGLYLYDKADGTSRTVFDQPQFFYCTHLLADEAHGLVYAARNNQPQIAVLNWDFNLVRLQNVQRSTRINDLALTPDGVLFAATDAGLQSWSPDGAPEPFWGRLLEDNRRGTDGAVSFVQSVPGSSDIIYGLTGGGYYMLDTEGKRLEPIWDKLSPDFSGQPVYLLTAEHFWIATGQGELRHRSFASTQDIIRLPDTGARDAVARVISWADDTVIVQTRQRILLVNTRSGETQDITPALPASDKSITHLRLDRAGRFWLILNYDTLLLYKLQSGRMVEERRWPATGARATWEDEEGNLCFIQDGRIHTIRDGERTSRPISRPAEFWRVFSTLSGKTYFIDEDHIYQYTRDGQFLEVPVYIPAPACLAEDTDGRLWIGSSSAGLVCYNPTDQSSVRITVKDGLPDNAIRSILPDESGIWVSMRNDLALIWQDFSRIQGIPVGGQESVDFANNAVTRNSSGNLVFGANGHLVVVDPWVQEPVSRRQVSLDALLVNNEPVEIPAGELVLSHDERLVNLYFSAIDFDFGKQLSYEFRLEGHDTQWARTGIFPQAFYSNLPAGRYRFLVRVQDPDGTWQEEQELLRLHRKPSPWLSPVAKTAWSLLILGTLLLLLNLSWRNRRNRERAEHAEIERSLSEQLSREKTDFFMNISHEYRTPLSLIYGPARELSRNNDLSEHDRYLVRVIERNSEKMLTLTEQVVNFNRLSREGDHLTVMCFDPGALLSGIIGNFDYVREQHKLTVDASLPRDLSVWCDRDKLSKIVFNLISNAFKYTPDGGTIMIDAVQLSKPEVLSAYELPEDSYNGPYLRIRVADTGVGIPPDRLEHIFERFERIGQQVGNKIPDGLGIGLNYVFYLIRLHRGAIKVSANKPQGAVFSFVLPAGLEAYSDTEIWHEVPVEASGKLSEPTPLKATDSQMSLLIVEDNIEMRTYLHDLFRGIYNVMLAGDGEEALRFIRISAPDLVISDIIMPYKDGFELCRDIKESEEYSHIPIILLTAKASQATQLEGLELGADAYLQKPFDPQALRLQVRNLLRARRKVQKALTDKTAQDVGEVLPALQLGKRDKAFLEKMYALIEEHLGDEEFNVSNLAGQMNVSRSGLFSKVKALTGQSPQAFLTGYRLSRARGLLLDREYNISEVAYMVGFSTLNGFSRAFKNKYGIPPSSL